jgi:prepilin-type N-terminal cleavage/methylation domain-containing protein
MDKKALTLLEILVSLVILGLLLTGLANIFLAGKRYTQRSRVRMAGGQIGKYFLDPLQNYVDQAAWASNPLGSQSVAAQNITIDGRNYKGEYNVNTTGLPGNLTRVKVTITLPGLD